MWRVLIGGVALALCACVDNGDAGDAAAQGSLGGPCFANNTCNTGLVCTLVNGKGVCQESDASTQDAPADTTTSETGSDATSDAPVADAGCDSGLTPSAVCVANCSGGLCCPLNGQCISSGCGTTCSGTCWSCARGSDCSGNFCCASNSTVQPTCPLTSDIAPSTVVFCSATPCTNGVFLCTNNADCPSTAPTCTPAKASGLSVSTIGVCQ